MDKFCNKRKGTTSLNKIRKRTNNICIYCGEELPEDNSKVDNYLKITVEHVIPQSVFKWIPEYMESIDNLVDICNDTDNLAIVHYRCNYYKNSRLPIESDIQKFKCSEKVKKIYLKYFKKVNKYIKKYREILKDLIHKQGGKCYCCNYELSLHNSTIRRLDISKERVIDNAVVVCNRCNSKFRKICEVNSDDSK